MKIYLIRHGKLKWEDNIKKCIGITDIGLSEEGIERAKEISGFLEDKNINRIYTSDLRRCEQSAKIISEYLGLSYLIEENLREINMGTWENKSFYEIKKSYPLDYEERGRNISTFNNHKGESFEDCYIRAVKVLEKICKNNSIDNNIVLIAHSGIIKCLIAYIDNIPLDNILNIEQNYGAINCISYINNKFEIKYLNKVG